MLSGMVKTLRIALGKDEPREKFVAADDARKAAVVDYIKSEMSPDDIYELLKGAVLVMKHVDSCKVDICPDLLEELSDLGESLDGLVVASGADEAYDKALKEAEEE